MAALYREGKCQSTWKCCINEHCLFISTESFKRKKRSVSATHVRTYRMIEGGIEHSGYIDIKQPPKIKGRKLKVSSLWYFALYTKEIIFIGINLIVSSYWILAINSKGICCPLNHSGLAIIVYVILPSILRFVSIVL